MSALWQAASFSVLIGATALHEARARLIYVIAWPEQVSQVAVAKAVTFIASVGNGLRRRGQMTRGKPASGTSTLGPEVYARWCGSGLGAITDRAERRLIGDLMGDIVGHALLDIGCGDGEPAVEFSKRGAAVTGIDASAAMIGAAKERATRENANVAFEVGLGIQPSGF